MSLTKMEFLTIQQRVKIEGSVKNIFRKYLRLK